MLPILPVNTRRHTSEVPPRAEESRAWAIGGSPLLVLVPLEELLESFSVSGQEQTIPLVAGRGFRSDDVAALQTRSENPREPKLDTMNQFSELE